MLQRLACTAAVFALAAGPASAAWQPDPHGADRHLSGSLVLSLHRAEQAIARDTQLDRPKSTQITKCRHVGGPEVIRCHVAEHGVPTDWLDSNDQPIMMTLISEYTARLTGAGIRVVNVVIYFEN